MLVFVVTLTSSAFLSRAYASACSGPKAGREGACAYDFQLKDLSGKTVTLSDHFGKVIFLNFWATWCEPCVVEMPELEKLRKRLSGKSFVMLTVSIDDEGAPAIEKFFKKVFPKSSPKFPVLLDSNQKVSKMFGTFKVPETYIIDPSGKIVDKVEGIRSWSDSLIAHYLELLMKQEARK